MCNCGKEDKYYSPAARSGLLPRQCYQCEEKNREINPGKYEQIEKLWYNKGTK